MAQKKQTLIMDENQTKIEQERNEHSQKMLEDAAKFQELQTTKDLERQNAQKALDNLRETHATKMAKETEDHRKKIEVVNSSIDQKKREIRQIIDENVEIIAQINMDTKFELEDI